MDTIRKYWQWILVGGIFFLESAILLFLNEDIYVGICDNLDLFITQLKMLKDQDAFFAGSQMMPILQGIDRNYFPTEFSLYNILYLFLPDVYAYIVGYLLRLVIAFSSFFMLMHLVLGNNDKSYEKPCVLVAAAFALLPVYPMYAFCFASMPLIVFLMIKIYYKPKLIYYVAIFLYPLVSYFSFFGIFILGYILMISVILGIRDKKVPVSLLGAFFVLFAGYVCFEHRLFQVMFFEESQTIRSTMVIASYTWDEIWKCFGEAFLYGVSHARSVHTYVVLPVCTLYFVLRNVKYIKDKNIKGMMADTFNLTVLFIIFNSAVYALYMWEPLRDLVEIVLPPLKGFHYGRTIFFNAFAWYFAFFIVIKEWYPKHKVVVSVIGVSAILVVGATQSEYSDFFNSVYCNLYKLVKNTETNQLNYREFYAEELFDKIKMDIEYQPEQGACAYGLHPATLSYNGITTIDGYCGYYEQAYKEEFREVIAPVLERVERWQKYYDEWGCRAYLFSANGENTYDFGENVVSVPQELSINADALQKLGCKYIFSRVEITNAEECELQFVSVYEVENIPYAVYVYTF